MVKIQILPLKTKKTERWTYGYLLDPVYTVPDLYGHDIKLNGFKTSVAFKFMLMLQKLIKTNHRKRGRNECDSKLTELDVVTMRIRYRVNGVLDII